MGATALGTYFAYNSQLTASESNHTSLEEQKPLLHLDWVQQVASASGAKMVLSASTMHTHPLLKKDHLVRCLVNDAQRGSASSGSDSLYLLDVAHRFCRPTRSPICWPSSALMCVFDFTPLAQLLTINMPIVSLRAVVAFSKF